MTTDHKEHLLISYYNYLQDRITQNLNQENIRLNSRMKLIDAEQKIKEVDREYRNTLISLKTAKFTRGLYAVLALVSIAASIFIYYYFRQKRLFSEELHRNQLQKKMTEVASLRARLTELLDQHKEPVILPPLLELNQLLENPLTEKEFEILQDVAIGKSNKEIADHQFISSNTVKFHLKNIFSKLDVENRKEAIRKILHDI